MKIIQQRQYDEIPNILWHQNLLLDYCIDGQMKGRPNGGRRWMQVLYMIGERW